MVSEQRESQRGSACGRAGGGHLRAPAWGKQRKKSPVGASGGITGLLGTADGAQGRTNKTRITKGLVSAQGTITRTTD